MTAELLNPTHVAIVLIIARQIFGAKRLPETGRALGRSIREFKDGITGRDDTSTDEPPDSIPRRRVTGGNGP